MRDKKHILVKIALPGCVFYLILPYKTVTLI